jgi:hypothetical protein
VPYVQPNLTLRSVLLAKIHTDPEVDPVPTAATDALLLHDEVNPVQVDVKKISPAYLTGTFTKSQDIIGRSLWKLNPQIYLQGSGDGSKPFFIDMLEACGFAVVEDLVGPPSSWTFTPLTEGVRPVALYHWSSGVQAKILRTYGTVTMAFTAGDVANMTFDMMGLYADPTDVAFPPTLALPTPRARQVEKEGLTIGAYTPRCHSLTFTWGAAVNERTDLNSPFGMYGTFIGDRAPTLQAVVEAETTLANYNPWTQLQNVTLVDISWTHGDVANPAIKSECEIACADWQITNVQQTEQDRRKMFTLDIKGQNSAPDGEIAITFREAP